MKLKHPKITAETPEHLKRYLRNGTALGLATVALAGCSKSENINAEKAPAATAGQTNPDTALPKPTKEATEPTDESMWPEDIEGSTSRAGESIGPNATPEEVATAFANSIVEADPETFCDLKWNDDCDPAKSADSPPIPEFAPLGATEVLHNPPYSVVELPREGGKWCITLIKLDDGWKVKEYTTPPGDVEQC